ncbi:DUF2059 domain-containing protein [Blastochloris viridis]|uniref:DUF2059 domain-containing protein n=1 Tax=Blastochloris viridis TaxID=1079 RepID=A0A0H5BAN2_BLAVI|nr:DUF2059 domain-containing protein [Blastochloris viridis]ALK08583.1 hypothetical protein BVIR_790 [Blastochloris viridis]BAR98129.1 hypothetical protein BV133_536 [Blastochloris viridis]CUU41246.1 hypothetical protein BVIRIDIS_02350 [Blastochloris viridis]
MTVRVRVFAAALACLLAPALPALAQAPQPQPATQPKPPADPQLIAIARDYARAAELTAGLSRSLPAISEQIVRAVRQKNPSASDDTIRAFSDALFDEFLLKRAGEIEAVVIDILVEIYSKEELTALKTFYSSPVGQAIIKKQPQLGAKLPTALQDWTRRAAPEAVQAAGARMKAAGKELRL